MVCFDEGGRGRASVRLIAPPGILGPWVEHFFLQNQAGSGSAAWRVVPDPSAHIIFSIGDGRPRFQLVGSRSSYCDIDTSRRRATAGVRFRAGALMQLARCGADELTDRSIPVEDVFGPAGKKLGARMANRTARSALQDLARFLCERFAVCQPDNSMETILQRAPSVASASRMMNMPLRTFRERASRVMGLPPKRLLRIRRLFRALRLGSIASPAWSEIATDVGYADQAHMTREFAALLGEPPERWRQRGAADSGQPAG